MLSIQGIYTGNKSNHWKKSQYAPMYGLLSHFWRMNRFQIMIGILKSFWNCAEHGKMNAPRKRLSERYMKVALHEISFTEYQELSQSRKARKGFLLSLRLCEILSESYKNGR